MTLLPPPLLLPSTPSQGAMVGGAFHRASPVLPPTRLPRAQRARPGLGERVGEGGSCTGSEWSKSTPARPAPGVPQRDRRAGSGTSSPQHRNTPRAGEGAWERWAGSSGCWERLRHRSNGGTTGKAEPVASRKKPESQHGGGWKGPLWVTQSNPPAEAGSPRAGCTGPCPGGS